MIRDKKAVILLNKSDLSTVVDKKALETLITKPMIDISAKEETGIHELESTLKEMFYHGDISFNDEVISPISDTKQLLPMHFPA